ncbi:hypothetical protein Tco_1560185, partial [Tanacetum coccineum]
EHLGCQTTDQHDELIKMGIKPTLKGVKWDQKFPYVILCAHLLEVQSCKELARLKNMLSTGSTMTWYYNEMV